MKNIAIIKNGVVENLVAVETNNRASTRAFWETKGYLCIDDAVGGIGWTWDGAKLVEPETEPEVVVTRTKFSRLEFMNKFTNNELMALYTLAKTEVAVEVWLDKFKLAEYVDVNNPDTIAGIQMMSQIGILAEGRSNEILGIA